MVVNFAIVRRGISLDIEGLERTEIVEVEAEVLIDGDRGGTDGLMSKAFLVEVREGGRETMSPSDEDLATLLLQQVFERFGLLVEKGLQSQIKRWGQEDITERTLGIRRPHRNQVWVSDVLESFHVHDKLIPINAILSRRRNLPPSVHAIRYTDAVARWTG